MKGVTEAERARWSENMYKYVTAPKVDAGKALKSRVAVQLHVRLVQTRACLVNNPTLQDFVALAMQE